MSFLSPLLLPAHSYTRRSTQKYDPAPMSVLVVVLTEN
jgi:hypothetical protein